MIFIVKEQGFAGSITIHVGVYGIEAADFDEAKEILTKIIISGGGRILGLEKYGNDEFGDKFNYYSEILDRELHYEFPGVSGSMKNEGLKMLSLVDVCNPPKILDWKNLWNLPPEEKTSFDVLLVDSGTNKISMCKELRKNIPGLTLLESVGIFNEGSSKEKPTILLEGITKEKANLIKENLEKFGANVEIR